MINSYVVIVRILYYRLSLNIFVFSSATTCFGLRNPYASPHISALLATLETPKYLHIKSPL